MSSAGKDPPGWSDLPPLDNEPDEDFIAPDDASVNALEPPSSEEFGTSVYEVESTSLQSAEGTPIPLSLRPDDGTATTRRILSWKIVDNQRNPDAKLHVRLHHQRRRNTKAPWGPVASFNPTKLKGGEEVSLDLHADEVLQLYGHLTQLYELAKGGVPRGSRAFQVIDKSKGVAVFSGQEGQLLTELIARYGNSDLFDLLKGLAPDLFAAAGLSAIHESRTTALHKFEAQMGVGAWSENDWYPFFEQNQWIFGHGLAYQFLQNVQQQPYFGGQGVTGKGAQKGDYLMASVARVRFTVLVEVKRPNTPLLGKQYRAGVYNLGDELTGGIAQLQTNCRTWATEGSKTEANESLDIATYEPKGILVIGNLSQFEGKDKRAMTGSFELFRRNLRNPEIVTFDELLERARFLVMSAVPDATRT